VVIGDDAPISGGRRMLWLIAGLVLVGGVVGYSVFTLGRRKKAL
jgi:hypothetical protein